METTTSTTHQNLAVYFREIRLIVEEDARTMGWNDLPMAEHDWYASYWSAHHRYQQLIDQNNQELQVETIKLRARQATADEAQTKQRLTDKRLSLSRDRAAVHTALEHVEEPAPSTKLSRDLATVAVYAVGILDGIMNRAAFSFIRLTEIEGLLLSMGVGGLLAFLAHSLPKAVKHATTKTHKWLLGGGIVAIAAIIVYSLSVMRALHIEKEALKAGFPITVNPIFLASLSLFFFAAATLMAWLFYPKAEVEHARKTHATLHKQAKDHGAGLASIEQATEAAEEKRKQIHAECAQLLTTGQMIENQIISEAESQFSAWKKLALLNRHDKTKPADYDCPYPLPFKTFFQPQNILNQ